jgi:hypothetical protein
VRNSKKGDPGGTESISTDFCGNGRKRDSFSPSGGSVIDSKDVCVTLGGRKRANQIDVDVGEAARRNRNGNGMW